MSEAMNGRQSSNAIRETDIPLIDRPVPSSPTPANRVLTVAEVARELRCSKAHAHNLINGKVRGAKPLPCVKIGRRCLVRRSSLDEWIKASEQCYDPIIANH
jgi:excisionase family DNA binding protein